MYHYATYNTKLMKWRPSWTPSWILKMLKNAGHHSGASIPTYSLTEYQMCFTIQLNSGSNRNI